MVKVPKSSTKKIRKGDKVLAIAGNDKGQIGVVQTLQGDRAVVEGLNVRKKHIKPAQESRRGRIVDIERAIHVSNLKVIVEGESAAKLKVRTNNGERHFVYKNGENELVYRSVKKPK